MDPDQLAAEEAAFRQRMADALAALGPEYEQNLLFLVNQALLPDGLRTFFIPTSNLMDLDTFPLFIGWYLEDHGVTLTPILYMNMDPIKLLLI